MDIPAIYRVTEQIQRYRLCIHTNIYDTRNLCWRGYLLYNNLISVRTPMRMSQKPDATMPARRLAHLEDARLAVYEDEERGWYLMLV